MLNIIISAFIAFAGAHTKPKSTQELRDVAVMIVNTERNSGGTGSVLVSGINSLVLTNRHVCQVVIEGGFVVKGNDAYSVVSYKEYTEHDLCLVKVNADLGVSLKLAHNSPKPSEESNVTGFPLLLPNTITKGHFSDVIVVEVAMGDRECTKEEMQTDIECVFYGTKAITEIFRAQHTSNLIQPGNSGSGVFNADGELAGVVFAGIGDLGFGLIVPHSYVYDFIENQTKYPWTKPTEPKSKKNKKSKSKRLNFDKRGRVYNDMVYRG